MNKETIKNIFFALLVCTITFVGLITTNPFKSNNSTNITKEFKTKEERPYDAIPPKKVSENKKRVIHSQHPKPSQVVIKGLGNYTESTLNEISSYVKKFYGYSCTVESSVQTCPEMYDDNGTSLEVENCVKLLRREGTKMIYVTDENVVADGMQLRGGTIWMSNTIILESTSYNKKTVLHEIGHTLGLSHCDDKNCLMSIYNDDYIVEDFCDKCKNILKDNGKFQ